METGFLNKLDSEYFSTDVYDQSNGFESENSLFNVFSIDYVDRSSEWIIPEELSSTSKPDKQYKEDFRKTFEDWQQHLSSMQSRNEAFKAQLLCSPIPDEFPDIFGAPVSIPIEKIKSETLHEEEYLNNDVVIKQEQVKENYNNINDNILLDIDKTKLYNPLSLELEETQDLYKKILIKEEYIEDEIIADVNVSPMEEMPVLSPVEGNVEVVPFEGNVSMLPPTLEISGNGNKSPSHANLLTTDLGPDNYDVVEIKVEPDDESPEPVIEAPNLETVLEQFDFSESIMDNNNKYVPKLENNWKEVGRADYTKRSSHKVRNNAVKDVLPREVINRIKDSSMKRKEIAIVPATRLPVKGFDHMKDAGIMKNTFSKLIKPGESLLIKNQLKERNIKESVESRSAAESESIKNRNTVPNESLDNSVQNGDGCEEPKKKKKLNLEEYRSRRKNIKTKPSSPTKLFMTGDVNGFRKMPELGAQSSAENNPTVPVASNETQTPSSDEKKENKKRDSSKDRRSSRPLQRYRRRSSTSSTSSSIDARSRARWRRDRSRRRRYSKGRGQRSRSRSRSTSSVNSLSSSSSLSRSRSRTKNSTYYYKSSSRSGYSRRNNYSRHTRYSQERISRRHDDWSSVEKMRQIEERRVIYVGQIEEGTTKSQLRERFETFGPIIDLSLHFRDRGDNYGFVTFAYKVDAYKAVEHGNDYPLQPQYDICFGGRRAFCKQRYSDLDGTSQGYSPYHQNPRSNDSFDLLLREAQEKIRKQKHV